MTQHRAVGAERQHVGGGRAVLLEQRRGRLHRASRRAPGAGGRCALRKFCRRKHVRRLRAADQHGAARAGFDQPDAAQDQRAHDAFAEVRLGDDQRAQLLGRHQQRLDVLVGVRVDERGPPESWATSPRNARAAALTIGVDAAQAIALADA